MSDLIGQSLGRYHILEQLGEGGMATVYKAFDTRLETDVAVKVIRTENILPNALERALKRFEREAKSLARLTHPNIVGVKDFGEYEGRPYLVMEYLPGGTLKERLGVPIPWQDAVRLLLPIAGALEYAHEHNLIHRDIKPSNILLTEKGQPMLTDFGIAKLLDLEETQDLTGTSAAVGTPEYMAPEQVNAKTVDHRVDIYALGIVLYEMLTGRKPFMADTPMAVLIMQARDPLPGPQKFVPNLPDKAVKLLLKALAKNPADRHASMGDFANALESLLTESTTSGGKQSSRKRGSTVNVPDVGSDEGGVISSKPAKNAHDLGASKPHLTKGDWATLVEWVLITSLGWAVGWGGVNVLSNLVDGVFYTWIAGAVFTFLPAVGQWLILRDRTSKAGWWIIASTLAWTVSWGIADATSMLGSHMVFYGMHEELLEDGTPFFSVDAALSLGWFIWDIQKALILGALAGTLTGFGQWLVLRRWIKKAGWWIPISILAGILNLGVLHVLISSLFSSLNDSLGWQLANSVIGALVGFVTGLVTCSALVLLKQNPHIPADEVSKTMPHAKAIGWVILPFSIILLVIAQLGGSKLEDRVQDQANATALSRATTTAMAQEQVTASAKAYESQLIATVLARPIISMENLPQLKLVSTLEDSVYYIQPRVVFSNNGFLVAAVVCLTRVDYVCENELRIWRAADGSLLQKIPLSGDNSSHLLFSPDDQVLALMNNYSEILYWRVADWQQLDSLQLGTEIDMYLFAFSPDGGKLAAGDGDGGIQMWDYVNRILLYELPDPNLTTSDGKKISGTSLAFSPDGNMVATSTSAGTVRVIRVSDGLLLNELAGEHNVWNLVFSPDGQILAEALGNSVLVWNVADWSLLYTIWDHTEWVRSVAFSPDGQILASAAEDGTIRFWKVQDGSSIYTLYESEPDLFSLAFSPDGRLLMNDIWSESMEEGRIHLWGILP